MASRPCLVLVVFERQDGGRLYESLNHRRITINLPLFPQNFTLQFEAFSFSVVSPSLLSLVKLVGQQELKVSSGILGLHVFGAGEELDAKLHA